MTAYLEETKPAVEDRVQFREPQFIEFTWGVAPVLSITFRGIRSCENRKIQIEVTGEAIYDHARETVTLPNNCSVTFEIPNDLSKWELHAGEIPDPKNFVEPRVEFHKRVLSDESQDAPDLEALGTITSRSYDSIDELPRLQPAGKTPAA